jgi:hypothetical protein
VAQGIGGDRGYRALAFRVALAAADGDGGETVSADLQIVPAQRHQLGPAAERGVGNRDQGLVAQVVQGVAGLGQ